MGKFRLRTKFLFSLILVGVGLTVGALLVARQTAEQQVRLQINQDLRNSVYTFHNVQQLREQSLTHSAELLAYFPILKAQMTTHDTATIQDASRDQWTLAGSDLLVLADRTGKVVALHSKAADFDRATAQESLSDSLSHEPNGHWWFCGKHLFEVSIQPIYVGTRAEGQIEGYAVLGYEIDDAVARELSQVAASQVVFLYGNTLVRSTLSPLQETDLIQHSVLTSSAGKAEPAEIQLGQERFLVTRVDLTRRSTCSAAVRFEVSRSGNCVSGTPEPPADCSRPRCPGGWQLHGFHLLARSRVRWERWWRGCVLLAEATTSIRWRRAGPMKWPR